APEDGCIAAAAESGKVTVTPSGKHAVFRAAGLEANLPLSCRVTATDGGGVVVEGEVSLTFKINAKPTVSEIAGRDIEEDATTGPIDFTVGDDETAAENLTVTAHSDNQTLVPDARISLGGFGAARIVTVAPAANKFGTATITVNVSDGFSTVTSQFTLTVSAANDLPTIGATPSYSPASTIGGNAYYEGRNVTITVAPADPDTADPTPDVVAADWGECVAAAGATAGKVSIATSGNTATVFASGLVRSDSPMPFGCQVKARDSTGAVSTGAATVSLSFIDLDAVEDGKPLEIDGEAIIDPVEGTTVELLTVEETGVLTLKGGLEVAGDLTVEGKLIFDFEEPEDILLVHGNVVVLPGGEITHAAGNVYGVNVAGDLDFVLQGKVDVSEKGCRNLAKAAQIIRPAPLEQGPTSGEPYYAACNVTKSGAGASGGSHGGVGENAVNGTTGAVYGGIFSPTYLGSAGAAVKTSDGTGLEPGAGGGRVWIRVAGTFDADGQVLADGGAGRASATFDKAGGGAGGAIFIESGAFAAGELFTIRASGGASTVGGGGGGGRIALWYDDFKNAEGRALDVTDDLAPGDRAALGKIVAEHIYAAPGNHQRNNASGTVVLRDKDAPSGKHDIIAGSNGPAADYDGLPGEEYLQSGAVADAAGGETVLPDANQGGAASYGFYGSLVANGAKFKWGSAVSFTGSWIVIGGGSTLIVTAEDLTNVSSQELADALAEASTLVVEGAGTKIADLSTLPDNVKNVTVSAAAELQFTNPEPVLAIADDRTLKVLGALTTTDGTGEFESVTVAGTFTAGAPTEIVSKSAITVTGTVTSSNSTANVRLVAEDVAITDAGTINATSGVSIVSKTLTAAPSSIDGGTVMLRVGEVEIDEEKHAQLETMVKEPTPQKLIIAPAVTADAGVDQVVTSGAPFILNGMRSSEDAIRATRVWSCIDTISEPDNSSEWSEGRCVNVVRTDNLPNNISAVYEARFVDDVQEATGSRSIYFRLTISDQ
ncbi:MAG TPA: hypothetical protein PLY45_01515, partial [bacterium]|nr:hypothetical protein [bacterium]